MADITKRLDVLERAVADNRTLLLQILAEIRGLRVTPAPPPIPIYFPPPIDEP